MYLGCRFYLFVYVEFFRILLERRGLYLFLYTYQLSKSGSGGMAYVLLGVHGRSATSMAEHSPEAPPGHVQLGVRLTHSAHYPWRNLSISKAF